jgi:hypothetical protein
VARLEPERDAIVTMNWDVALEEALRNSGAPSQYDVLPATSGFDRPDGLLILKPQDSVDWARINPLPGKFEPVLSIGPAPPKPHWVVSRRTGPPPAFPATGVDATDPAIIPPSFIGEDRTQELDWSGYILNITKHAAIHAKKIVVVGYSLPPDDFHMLATLSYGLPQDSWGDGIEIFVIDPSTDTFRQWRSAFQGVAALSGKPISVRHWAPTLDRALKRKGGPWA